MKTLWFVRTKDKKVGIGLDLPGKKLLWSLTRSFIQEKEQVLSMYLIETG